LKGIYNFIAAYNAFCIFHNSTPITVKSSSHLITAMKMPKD